MNMRSHLALAVYLSERLDLRSFAFIFGNVQPDLAVYSSSQGLFLVHYRLSYPTSSD